MLLAAAVAALSVHAAAARTLTFAYRSSAGTTRTAYVVLPAWYGPRRHPALPLVISPHGRGVDGLYNLRFWGDLPARGPFVLVSPDGQGRRLALYSWGYPGQVADLARMPALLRGAFPWLRLDARRVYAIGSSMGAQESLLLLARGMRLAGVAALDPVTSMAARYRKWFVTAGEHALPALARVEFGGTPTQVPAAYAARSPATFVRAIARSGVPLQLWWSRRDAVVTDQATETGAFFRRLLQLEPAARVLEVVGYWQHAHEMHPETQLPAVLACFGLLSPQGVIVPAYRLGAGGVQESPGTQTVPFTRAFCGRATS